MTKQPTDYEIHRFGHSIVHGRSALQPHRKHRVNPLAHDLDVLLSGGHLHYMPNGRVARIHQHGRDLHDPGRFGGHAKAPVRRHKG
jgi:hypothetical protein